MQVIAAKNKYYHGTCSKFAHKILKEGFTPNPKEQVWDQNSGRLATYGGTYFTDEWMVAYSAAGNAYRKFGGNRVIFEVQIESKTALLDEDTLTISFSILHPLKKAFHVGNLTSGYAKRLFDFNESWSEKDFEDSLKEAANHWIEYYSKFREKLPPIHEKKKNLLIPPLVSWGRAYLKKLSEGGHDTTEIPEEREAAKKIMKLLKVEPLGLRESIRVESPIKFKGSNKIISALEIIEKENEKTILKPLYGNVSQDFYKKYLSFIGENFIVKEGAAVEKKAILEKRYNKNTGKKQYALISKSNDKVLQWFGETKPSDDLVQKAEKRVMYFKHLGFEDIRNIVIAKQFEKGFLSWAEKFVKIPSRKEAIDIIKKNKDKIKEAYNYVFKMFRNKNQVTAASLTEKVKDMLLLVAAVMVLMQPQAKAETDAGGLPSFQEINKYVESLKEDPDAETSWDYNKRIDNAWSEITGVYNKLKDSASFKKQKNAQEILDYLKKTIEDNSDSIKNKSKLSPLELKKLAWRLMEVQNSAYFGHLVGLCK